MRVNPFVVPWGIDPSEWEPVKSEGYVLWAKGRANDINDPTPLVKLADRAYEYNFVSTFGSAKSNLRITGILPFDEMRDVIRKASVYLATTRETFGIQTLEAMASGIPVLGYNWAATPDLVTHMETGYLATPGDIEDLYRGLIFCSENRRRLGQAARETALKFTWEATADAMAQVYTCAMKQHQGPLVSIVIPCYNYEKWVGEAIDSALIQSDAASLEVIVVNDNSTDNSHEVIQRYADAGSIVYVRNEKNVGVANARNRGASVARGQYIAFLDADDRMEPGWLRACLTAIQQNARAGLTFTRLQILGPDGSLRMSNWPTGASGVQQLLAGQNTVPTCCLIRKEVFDRAGGYKRRYEPGEDCELWMRIAECGYNALCASQKPLFTYRMGHTSLSRIKPLPDHKPWHIPTLMGRPPFAAISATKNGSSPVRDYDRPVISVVILHPKKHTREDLIDTLDILYGQTYRFWEASILGSGPLPNMKSYPFVSMLTEASKGLRAPLVFTIESGYNIFNARTLENALAEWQSTGQSSVLIHTEALWPAGVVPIRDLSILMNK
jgi:glycosyltransferase involved in cell wall biosynthesis